MNFFVEDSPHRSVLCSLGIPRRCVHVLGAKGDGIKRLKSHPGDIGMVDEDPGDIQNRPHELDSYKEVAAGEGLQLLVRQGSHGQRLVVLCPRVENWLIERAMTCGMDLRQYHLPGTTRELKNLVHYEDKDWFRRFLGELGDRDIDLLRQWVSQ